jgi:hypothetical protein
VSIHEKLPDVSVLSFTPKGKLRRLGITNPKANEVKCYYSVGGQGLRLSLPLRTGEVVEYVRDISLVKEIAAVAEESAEQMLEAALAAGKPSTWPLTWTDLKG